MNTSETLQLIERALTEVLGHNSFQLTAETTADDVDGWDSISHMMIINELEEKLGVKFKLMDLMNLQNVGDLMNMIQKESQIMGSN